MRRTQCYLDLIVDVLRMGSLLKVGVTGGGGRLSLVRRPLKPRPTEDGAVDTVKLDREPKAGLLAVLLPLALALASDSPPRPLNAGVSAPSRAGDACRTLMPAYLLLVAASVSVLSLFLAASDMSAGVVVVSMKVPVSLTLTVFPVLPLSDVMTLACAPNTSSTDTRFAFASLCAVNCRSADTCSWTAVGNPRHKPHTQTLMETHTQAHT